MKNNRNLVIGISLLIIGVIGLRSIAPSAMSCQVPACTRRKSGR